jgi:hypothetical protein
VASPITGVLQQRRDPMGGKQDSWVCCDPNGREWKQRKPKKLLNLAIYNQL